MDRIAFSSGELVDSSNDGKHEFYTWKNEIMPDFFLLILPKNAYHIKTQIIYNKELDFYFITKDTSVTNKIINESQKAFEFYNSLLGDYRHHKFTIFEIPDNLNYAMSLDRCLAWSYDFIHAEPKSRKFLIWASHEIAHQWNGEGYFYLWDSKFCKFMGESLTEYLRLIFIEHYYGTDSLINVYDEKLGYYNENCYHSIKDVPVSSNDPTSQIPYCKGPLIFKYVDHQIGRENFINFIRTLYSKYYGKVIDYNIFKEELSKYDPTGKVIKRMEEMTEMKGVLPDE